MKKSLNKRFNWLSAAASRSREASQTAELEQAYTDKFLAAVDPENKPDNPFGMKMSEEFKETFSPGAMYATLTDPVIRKSPLELLDLREATQTAMGVTALQNSLRSAMGAELINAGSQAERLEFTPPRSLTDLQKEYSGIDALTKIEPPGDDNAYYKGEVKAYSESAKAVGEALSPLKEYIIATAEVASLRDVKQADVLETPGLNEHIVARLDTLSQQLSRAGFEDAATFVHGQGEEFKATGKAEVLEGLANTLFAAYSLEKEQIVSESGYKQFIDSHKEVSSGMGVDVHTQALGNALAENRVIPEDSQLGSFIANEGGAEPSVPGLYSASLLDTVNVALSMDKSLAVVSTEKELSSADIAEIRSLIGEETSAKYTDKDIIEAISADNFAFSQAAGVTSEDIKAWTEVLKLDEIDGNRDATKVDELTALSAGLDYLNSSDFYTRENLDLTNESKVLPNIELESDTPDTSLNAKDRVSEHSQEDTEAEQEIEME